MSFVLPLVGCPPYEGPIDVILVDMDDTAEVTWAEAGASDFQACDGFVSNPEAAAACGPYGKGEAGTYTIRVTWQGASLDKEVTLESDGDYHANAEVTFAADELTD